MNERVLKSIIRGPDERIGVQQKLEYTSRGGGNTITWHSRLLENSYIP